MARAFAITWLASVRMPDRLLTRLLCAGELFVMPPLHRVDVLCKAHTLVLVMMETSTPPRLDKIMSMEWADSSCVTQAVYAIRKQLHPHHGINTKNASRQQEHGAEAEKRAWIMLMGQNVVAATAEHCRMSGYARHCSVP